MSQYFERSKDVWKRAGEFPADKEKEYPEHTIVQDFNHITGKDVYEYGIGGGSDLMSYLRRGNRVWGTDIVPENIEVARKRILDAGFNKDQFNLVLLQDSYPLPFQDNSFDIISSHGVLHHIPDPKPIVKEMYRIMKPGGFIYIMLYSTTLWYHFEESGQIANFIKQYGISEEEAFGYCTDSIGVPYAIPYTVEMGYELLQQAGFHVEDHTYWLNDFFVTYKGSK